MLNKQDIEIIEDIFDRKLEPMEEKISHLPTKDEFFQWMDKIMGELQEIREEIAISYGRIDDRENRITSLEKFHPN